MVSNKIVQGKGSSSKSTNKSQSNTNSNNSTSKKSNIQSPKSSTSPSNQQSSIQGKRKRTEDLDHTESTQSNNNTKVIKSSKSPQPQSKQQKTESSSKIGSVNKNQKISKKVQQQEEQEDEEDVEQNQDDLNEEELENESDEEDDVEDGKDEDGPIVNSDEITSGGGALTEETFDSLDIHEKTKESIKLMGFNRMREIQSKAVPYGLEGKDILGKAKTGSGKTLAFLIPTVEVLLKNRFNPKMGTGAIIISPTRELALQTFGVCHDLLKTHNLTHGVVIGGANRHAETEKLKKGGRPLLLPPQRWDDRSDRRRRGRRRARQRDRTRRFGSARHRARRRRRRARRTGGRSQQHPGTLPLMTGAGGVLLRRRPWCCGGSFLW